MGLAFGESSRRTGIFLGKGRAELSGDGSQRILVKSGGLLFISDRKRRRTFPCMTMVRAGKANLPLAFSGLFTLDSGQWGPLPPDEANGAQRMVLGHALCLFQLREFGRN